MKISEEHNVFMEITNPIHGGEGWDLGEVLWSPAESAWKNMRDVTKGDIVIHSISENKPHKLIGISVVKNAAKTVNDEPPKPGKWGNRDSYYRIELQEYCSFKKVSSTHQLPLPLNLEGWGFLFPLLRV